MLTVGSILELLRDANLIPEEQPHVTHLYEIIEYAGQLRDERDGKIPITKRRVTFFIIGIHLDRGRVNHGGTYDRDEAVTRAHALAIEHAGGRWGAFFVESNQKEQDEEIASFAVRDAGFLPHPRREPD